MARDWLDASWSRRLVERLRRIAVGGAAATLALSASSASAASDSQAQPVKVPLTSPVTIVDRSKKAAKLVLRLPGALRNMVASHGSHSSHSSHSSHRSHSSHVSGAGGAAVAPAPSTAIIGTIESVNATTKTIRVKDSTGMLFEFMLRDDTTVPSGASSSRFDEYLEGHQNLMPFRKGQSVTVGWKMATDGKKRIATQVR